jgi:prophage regulatory protein
MRASFQPSDQQLFLTARDLSRRYGVSVATIWRWSSERTDFPRPLKLGTGCTRWSIQDLEAFEAKVSGVLS